MHRYCRLLPRCVSLVVLAVLLLYFAAPASAQQQVVYGPAPGQRADLYTAATGAPVLVLVPGGGWVQGDPSLARPFATALQAAGVTVLVPAYTLGAPHTAAGDVAQAVVYASALPGRGRLTLGGHSAGAHLAALVALDQRASAEGLLLLSGIYDLASMVRDGGLGARLVQQAFGRDAAVWTANSPRTLVHAGVPPTWVVHGAVDSDVRPQQTSAFAASLQEVGAPVTWQLVPRAGHVDLPQALMSQQRDALVRFLHGERDGSS